MANTLSIKSARIGFKNFRGLEGDYNRAGDRNFVIFLDPEFAGQLEEEGWNIKWPKVSAEELNADPEDRFERQPYLPVSVDMVKYPANVFIIREDPESPLANPKGFVTTQLDDQSVGVLDTALIVNADVVIRPYNWTVNGNSGVKAYLKNMYVEIDEDEFASEYGI